MFARKFYSFKPTRTNKFIQRPFDNKRWKVYMKTKKYSFQTNNVLSKEVQNMSGVCISNKYGGFFSAFFPFLGFAFTLEVFNLVPWS